MFFALQKTKNFIFVLQKCIWCKNVFVTFDTVKCTQKCIFAKQRVHFAPLFNITFFCEHSDFVSIQNRVVKVYKTKY